MNWMMGMLAVVVVVCAAPCAHADYEQAVQTLARGRLEQARSQLVKPAKAGDVRAQALLGRLMLARRNAAGMPWLRKAAESGYVPAQVRLGRLRMKGMFGPREPKKAVAWFERAIANEEASDHAVDHSYAQFWLGEAYREGWGVAKDEKRSLALFKDAAELGNERAQYEYGKALAGDLRDPTNLVESHKYVVLAWKQDYVLNKSMAWDKPTFSPRDVVLYLRMKMSESELEESRADVRSWLDAQKSGELGQAYGLEVKAPAGMKTLIGNERGWESLHTTLWYFTGGSQDDCSGWIVNGVRQIRPAVEHWTIEACGEIRVMEVALFMRGPSLKAYGARYAPGQT